MRRLAFLALLPALLILGPARAQSSDAALETYLLTMPNVRKMVQALESLDASAKKNPALAAKLNEDAGASDLDQLLSKCQADPTIKAAFSSAGISVRDGVMTQAALAFAAAGAYVQEQTGKPPEGASPTLLANIKSYRENLAEIEPLIQRLRKLGILQSDGGVDGEGDEGDETDEDAGD
jgi:hypothetical protein